VRRFRQTVRPLARDTKRAADGVAEAAGSSKAQVRGDSLAHSTPRMPLCGSGPTKLDNLSDYRIAVGCLLARLGSS
jgi:hypothetical protein